MKYEHLNIYAGIGVLAVSIGLTGYGFVDTYKDLKTLGIDVATVEHQLEVEILSRTQRLIEHLEVSDHELANVVKDMCKNMEQSDSLNELYNYNLEVEGVALASMTSDDSIAMDVKEDYVGAGSRISDIASYYEETSEKYNKRLNGFFGKVYKNTRVYTEAESLNTGLD